MFGANPIKGWATEYVFDDDTFPPREIVPEIKPSDERTRTILNRIWEVYGHETGAQLSARTHTPGSPWDQVRNKSQGVRNADIDNKTIQDHYEKLRKKAAKGKDGRA